MTRTTRKLTGVEILAVVVASALVLLAGVMFIAAVAVSLSPTWRHAEGVSIRSAWMASFTSGIFASCAARAVDRHLARAFPRQRR